MRTEFSAVLTSTGPSCLVITGEIDQFTAPGLRRALAAAVEPGREPLLLDLSAVCYLDSCAIAVLFEFAAAGDLEIIATAGSAVDRVLRICGLMTVARLRQVDPIPAPRHATPQPPTRVA